MRKNLTKKERLKKNSDFQRIFSKGNVKSCYGARLYWIKNNCSFNRFAVTLTKKFGNAVNRNTNKRWIREIYRNVKGNLLEQGYDFLFLLFPGNFSFNQRKAQVYSLISMADLLDKKSGVTHG